MAQLLKLKILSMIKLGLHAAFINSQSVKSDKKQSLIKDL